MQGVNHATNAYLSLGPFYRTVRPKGHLAKQRREKTRKLCVLGRPSLPGQFILGEVQKKTTATSGPEEAFRGAGSVLHLDPSGGSTGFTRCRTHRAVLFRCTDSVTPYGKEEETRDDAGRDAPPLAAGDRCLSLEMPLSAPAPTRRQRPAPESCAARLGPGEVPTATASRSPRLPSDEAPAKTRSPDRGTGATERGCSETAAGHARRGATGRLLSLRGHSEGIQQAPLSVPRGGHELLPGRSAGVFAQLSAWGRWRAWLPIPRGASGVTPSLHSLTACFPACSASQVEGSRAGCWHHGSGSTSASNYLRGLQNPSAVWASRDGDTPESLLPSM